MTECPERIGRLPRVQVSFERTPHARDFVQQILQLYEMNDVKVMNAYRFLSLHGEVMQRRSPLVRQLMPRMQCYQNAYTLARRYPSKFRYVEGLGTSFFPMEHAWCIDPDGAVLDPTWGTSHEADYFGVVFDVKLVSRVRRLTHAWPVLWSWWKWPEILKILEVEYVTGDRPGAEGQRVETENGRRPGEAGTPTGDPVGG